MKSKNKYTLSFKLVVAPSHEGAWIEIFKKPPVQA